MLTHQVSSPSDVNDTERIDLEKKEPINDILTHHTISLWTTKFTASFTSSDYSL